MFILKKIVFMCCHTVSETFEVSKVLKPYVKPHIQTRFDFEDDFLFLDQFEDLDTKTTSEIVSIDTEYVDNSTQKFYVSLQIHVPRLEEKIFVINKNLINYYPTKNLIYTNLLKEFKDKKEWCTRILYLDLDDDNNSHLTDILTDLYKEYNLNFPKQILLLLFYAIKDLYPCFGYNALRPIMLKGAPSGHFRNSNVLYSRRNLKGQLLNRHGGKYKIVDLYGFTGGGGLKNAADSVGVLMEEKSKLDKYKSCIVDALLHDDFSIRETFLFYAMDDCLKLVDIWKRRVKGHNELLTDVLKFSDKYHIKENVFPSTVGSLVAQTFMNFILVQASQEVLVEEFKQASCRVGLLNKSHFSYEKNVSERDKILRKKEDFSSSVKRHCTSAVYSYDAINYASIPSFLTTDKSNLTALLAMVTGGRCTNERYKENTFYNVLDVDLSSCYGTSLASMIYPIGRPSVFSAHVNQKGITLGQFLKKVKKQLIPGLYKIVVCGQLSFEQDLIYSKLLSAPDQQVFYNQELDWWEEDEYLNTDHVLLKKEIVNGILTHDLLEIIQNVASNQELSEFFNLEVKAAAYWAVKNQKSSIKEWCNVVNNSTYPEQAEILLSWVGIPISNYINPLLIERQKIKSEMKKEKDKAQSSLLNGKQNSLKLLINTLYGVISSRFFRVGNCVVADNITAKPRADIWKNVKALGGIQVITDGFLYKPESVFCLQIDHKYFRKPSFHTLADYYRMKNSRYVKEKNLLDLPWKERFADEKTITSLNYAEIDKQCQNYVNNFWAVYNLNTVFSFEHKAGHTSYVAATSSKAHYALKTVLQAYVYKLRGRHEYCDDIRDPLYELKDNLLNGNQQLPDVLTVLTKKLVKIEDWRKRFMADCHTSLRPGDQITTTSILRFHPTFLPAQTVKQYKKMKKRSNNFNAPPYYEEHDLKAHDLIIEHMYNMYCKKDPLPKRKAKRRGPKRKRGPKPKQLE